jgi:GntR family transcriptional regulator/MocR family aminotransferase
MTAIFPLETIVIDRSATANLHRQLYSQLRHMIENHFLPSGSTLPSTRQLAQDLVIGRNTVITAYDQLALEGYLRIRRGTPPRVMDLPARTENLRRPKLDAASAISSRGKLMTAQPYHHGQPGLYAFHPGLPDAGNFPFNTWSKLLNRRAKSARRDLFGTYYIAGYPPLSEALARYLIAARGVRCSPEQIIVTNGARSAFDLLARLLVDPGDTVWMEEPGYYGASAAFVCAGARLAPLYVGDAGWDLDSPLVAPRLIFITPSCHHPLGVTMPMEQRLNLIRLAERWNAWIVEDDYDSEYRFQGQPIPALQGIGFSNRIVYVGTFAKVLFPAMRLGFMVVPPEIREAVVAALSSTGQFAPLITQAALADFINEGHLTRHLRRMRRLYTARRKTFIDLCERHLGDWLSLRRTESGIQLVGLFRDNLDDRKIAAAAQEQGINVSPLSIQYRHQGVKRGLVMGFASADEKTAGKAMLKLRKVLQSYPSS